MNVIYVPMEDAELKLIQDFLKKFESLEITIEPNDVLTVDVMRDTILRLFTQIKNEENRRVQ